LFDLFSVRLAKSTTKVNKSVASLVFHSA